MKTKQNLKKKLLIHAFGIVNHINNNNNHTNVNILKNINCLETCDYGHTNSMLFVYNKEYQNGNIEF